MAFLIYYIRYISYLPAIRLVLGIVTTGNDGKCRYAPFPPPFHIWAARCPFCSYHFITASLSIHDPPAFQAQVQHDSSASAPPCPLSLSDGCVPRHHHPPRRSARDVNGAVTASRETSGVLTSQATVVSRHPTLF